MRPTGPMREASSNVSQHALEQRDYDTRPPAPQEQSLLSRVADTLRTFCPRVFGINEHFSQESALREPFFRAPDWTYTCNIRDYLRSFFRPRSLGINHHFSQKSALKQPFFRAPDWTYARGKLKCFTTCPGATRLWYAPPRSAGTELALTRRRHPSDILSESFRHKWALFTGKCTTRALFPCARLDLYGLTCLPRCKHTHAYARQLTSSSSLLNIGSTWPLLLPTLTSALTSATICALQVFSHASTYSCLRSHACHLLVHN